MGSEHYCLRWNNHQSNLLGVFSQLLQDESLVDVTLACSEGTPIRAHKVVLSACSSYFQSLFLDHPEKHPIVILKDVRFAELQTLVEFMYKGEVNVQYCQLSALLKTAESLKVKGLAEMTNQNTTLREPEREPDRLRPHSQPNKGGSSTTTCESPVDADLSAQSTSSTITTTNRTPTTGPSAAASVGAAAAAASAAAAAVSSPAGTANIAISSNVTTTTGGSSSTVSTTGNISNAHKREASERSTPSPVKRQMAAEAEHNTNLPLDLYQRRRDHEHDDSNNERLRDATSASASNETNTQQQQHGSATTHRSGGAGGISSAGGGSITAANSGTCRTYNLAEERKETPTPELPGNEPLCVEKTEETDDEYDEEMDLDDDGEHSGHEMGLNMKLKTSASGSVDLSATAASTSTPTTAIAKASSAGNVSPLALSMGGGVMETESARSTPAIAVASDLTRRPSSRSSRDPADRPSSSCVRPSSASALSPSSAHGGGGGDSQPLAGPSGLAPVQSVPLSLKKEIDCSEDDNSSSRQMQPRSSSAGGGLSADLDYRASHESETSQSPHASGSGACPSGVSGNATCSHDQPQTPPPMYTCLYCGAGFSNQSKLTRHILSHSLKTLEYREAATHPLLHPSLLAHELNMGPLPQQFAYQMNAAMAASGADPQESAAAAAAMEMEIMAAVAAAGGCPITGLSTSCAAARALEMESSGAGSSTSAGGGGGGSGRCGGSSSGNGGIFSSGAGGSSSSTSAAAAAAAAAASSSSSSAALLGASSSDPNSVVLCKFCGKTFPDVTSLIKHLPVHTGDRPFKCEFCGKAFKLRHHMKDHCRVHTGERPFRCHMCGKTFSRSTILKAHEKTHFPKYVRKFLSSPSPVDTKDELPQ